MSFVAAAVGLGGVATLGSGFLQSGAARDAASTQAEAAKYAADLQNQQFQQTQQNQKPWLEAGQAALPQLSQMASSPVNFTKQDFLNNMDPGYQFNLEQGQQALERSAAARGGLMSGGILKDLSSYSQGVASNEYSNAYNRFMNNQNTQFNRLASMAGIGQNALGAINSAGMNMANNVGNIMTGSANAQGAAQIAQGGIAGNTLSGLASLPGTYMGLQNMQNWNNLLQSKMPKASSSGFDFSQPYVDSHLQMPSFGSGTNQSIISRLGT